MSWTCGPNPRRYWHCGKGKGDTPRLAVKDAINKAEARKEAGNGER